LQYTQRSRPAGFGCAQSACGQTTISDAGGAAAGAAATGERFSEKSIPVSDAPQAQRAAASAFSVSQTGQMRTYS
jgi:hypothetical protein